MSNATAHTLEPERLLTPKRRRVSSYRSPTELALFGPGDVLTAEPALPGFTLPVADLFPADI